MEESGAAQHAADESIGCNKTPQSSVTSIYRAKISGVLRTVTVVWVKSSMHHTLSISIGDGDGGGSSTCKVDLKPWPFWSRKGSKSLDVDGKHVDVSWNFRHVKFADGPEPLEGYYVAVVANDEASLLLGDRKQKAYRKTRSRPSPEDATLVSKKENVFGKKSFTARVRLDGERDHEIVVENSISSSSSSSASASEAGEGRHAAAASPEMSVSVDGAVVIHVSNLQWKFRGNATVWVEQAPVQVMWDVHDWLFREHGPRHALFIFKPGMPPPPESAAEEEDEGGHEERGGGGGEISSGDLETYRSNFNSSSEFCSFLHAWKTDSFIN